jgi:hypothetical protein
MDATPLRTYNVGLASKLEVHESVMAFQMILLLS